MKHKKHRLILFFLLATSLLTCTRAPAHAEESMGEAVFFGESTTAHLSRRGGVLDTPEKRGCVWRNESGTERLSRRILSASVDLWDSNGIKQTVSLADALKVARPRRIVLSFGLNGIMGFIENKDSFTGAYRVLVDGVRKCSPCTEIILQSVYPVRASDNFSCDTPTLNAHIRTLNGWISELARAEGLRYADTASVLRGTDGALLAKYDVGDGIHLTNEAYKEILAYLQAFIKKG